MPKPEKLSADDEVVEYSLVLEEVPFRVTNKDGSKRDLILRELDGVQRDDYLGFIGARLKMDSAGKAAGMSAFDRIQSSLLCKAVWDPAKSAYVPEGEIRKWPSSLIQKLYDRVQKISGLDVEAETAAKND